MSFRWTDFKVTLPFFGLIARNSKNLNPGRDGWLNAEDALCTTYKRYISQLPRDEFRQRIEYMKHAGDLGRTPMGTGLTIFLFLLVAAEAMGFSYLLGTWAASDGSANLYKQLMYGIVFVLASILAMVTHAAGAQYYRTSLLRACFARYKSGASTEQPTTRVIALSDDQFADRDEPPETRCMNRIINNPNDLGSYLWSWVAGVLVIAIFVLSGVMRFSHMEAEMTRQSQAAEAATSNPFTKSAMPAELVDPQQAADRKANSEVSSNTALEGGSAIIILGIIFVVTQIVGFGAGHKHCFAGKETYKKATGSNSFWWWSDKDGAYADTWGYATYEAYWDAMQPFKDIVNKRLKTLQARLVAHSRKNIVLNRTFDDYLSEHARDRRGAIADQNRSYQPAAVVPAAPAPVPPAVAAPATGVAAAAAGSADAATVSAIEQARRDIEAEPDKLRQQDIFRVLAPEVRAALAPWLKERKERAAAVSQAELDDLF